MRFSTTAEQATTESKFFYGWTIVAVGFLAHIASAFSISSTLSVFLKPLSSDLGISRGVFSLIRSGEILIGAAAAPLVGTVLDRHGGRWLMAAGGLISGAGFLLLGQSRDFWQFLLFRWLLVSPGDSLMDRLFSASFSTTPKAIISPSVSSSVCSSRPLFSASFSARPKSDTAPTNPRFHN